MMLNYDLNFLKVAKLVSEAEACHQKLYNFRQLYNPLVSRWNKLRHSCKHFTKIVKVVVGWYP
jgi:hypothetical protein